MKASIDLVDITYARLYSSPVKPLISGLICKYKRPLNSDKEDIVINTLPLSNDVIQKGIINVNIHVPNINLKSQLGYDNSLPNIERIRTLSKAVIEIFDEVWEDDYCLELQNETVMSEADNHFANIRILFYSLK
jgi:hypothetical protein